MGTHTNFKKRVTLDSSLFLCRRLWIKKPWILQMVSIVHSTCITATEVIHYVENIDVV